MADYDRFVAQSEIASSPLAEALARVGDRWTLLVGEALARLRAGVALDGAT